MLELSMNLVKSKDTKVIHRNPFNSNTLTMKKKKRRSKEREIKETILTTIAKKRTRYLGISSVQSLSRVQYIATP